MDLHLCAALLMATPGQFVPLNDEVVLLTRFSQAVREIALPSDTTRVIEVHGAVYVDGMPARIEEATPDAATDPYGYAVFTAVKNAVMTRGMSASKKKTPLFLVQTGTAQLITATGLSELRKAAVSCTPALDHIERFVIVLTIHDGKAKVDAPQGPPKLAECVEAQITTREESKSTVTLDAGPMRPIIVVPPPQGSLDPRAIRGVIQAHLETLRACDDHKAYGDYRLRFVISAAGEVSDISITAAPHRGESVARCLRDHVRTFRFPEPSDNGAVIVNYPFVFKSTP